MSSAALRRSEKPVTIGRTNAGKAGILKFDRRDGVIVLETTEPTSKSRSVIGLVRNLLKFLKPTGGPLRLWR